MSCAEYHCGCGDRAELIEYRTPRAGADYPPRQFYIRCAACGERSFRFASPHQSECNWATMEGNAVQRSDERRRVA